MFDNPMDGWMDGWTLGEQKIKRGRAAAGERASLAFGFFLQCLREKRQKSTKRKTTNRNTTRRRTGAVKTIAVMDTRARRKTKSESRATL